MSIIEKAASRIRNETRVGPETSTVSLAEVIDHASAVAPETPDARHVSPAVIEAAKPGTEIPASPAESGPKARPDTVPPRGTPPTVVELDLERMRNMGMVTAAGGRTALVEEFRVIKRPLLKHAFQPSTPGDKPNKDRKSVV